MFPCWRVLIAPFGQSGRFEPSKDEMSMALPYPVPDACPPPMPGSYPTGAGYATSGGNGGGKNAFPVAAGLVNNNTRPTIAKMATIPKSKMLTSFLSAMIISSCACALMFLLGSFSGVCTRFARSYVLGSNKLRMLLGSRGSRLPASCFRT